MDFDDLPVFCMNQHCGYDLRGFAFLEENLVVDYIANTYEDRLEQGAAFDGAFTGFHIYDHISKGGDKETWLIEILGWYDIFEYKDIEGPFYDSLEVTLNSCGLEDFYDEAIDYIIKNKGEL